MKKKSILALALMVTMLPLSSVSATDFSFGTTSISNTTSVIETKKEEKELKFQFLGYYDQVSKYTILAKINKIRKDACDNKVKISYSRTLQPSDYKPLKWSSLAEQIAGVRATEASILASHTRLNGNSSLDDIRRMFSYSEENLDWNYTGVLRTIDRFEEEKEALENHFSGLTSKEYGHYLNLIDPNYTHVGMVGFKLNGTDYFSVAQELIKVDDGLIEEENEKQVISGGNGIINLEVLPKYMKDEKFVFEKNEMQIDEVIPAELKSKIKIDEKLIKDKEVILKVANDLTWTSSDEKVVKVEIKDGKTTLKALKEGKSKITVKGIGKDLTSFEITVKEKTNGFVKVGEKTKYKKENGTFATGWESIDNTWYYFDSNGYRVESKWIGDYYLGKDGKMLVNTTTPDGTKVDSNGKRVSAYTWKYNSVGKWVVDTNGNYPVSKWVEINNIWYYFDSNGYAVTNTWIGNYYLGQDAKMVVSTVTPDGYTVDANGKWISSIAKKQIMYYWKSNSVGKWVVDANGNYPTERWLKLNNNWYYFDYYGYMATNTWVGNYYLGKDGKMLTSTRTPDGYTVDANGKWTGR